MGPLLRRSLTEVQLENTGVIPDRAYNYQNFLGLGGFNGATNIWALNRLLAWDSVHWVASYKKVAPTELCGLGDLSVLCESMLSLGDGVR